MTQAHKHQTKILAEDSTSLKELRPPNSAAGKLRCEDLRKATRRQAGLKAVDFSSVADFDYVNDAV
jgi:hypothetical protein